MPVLRRLNLPSKKKFALIVVFAMGGFACAVSIIRLHSLIKITSSKDLTYDNADTATWSAGELNISLICACLPALRPIAVRLLPNIFGTSTHSNAELQFKTASQRQVSNGGPFRSGRLRTSGDPFGSSELAVEKREASDDNLPLQSKCWPNSREEEYEMFGNSTEVENA